MELGKRGRASNGRLACGEKAGRAEGHDTSKMKYINAGGCATCDPQEVAVQSLEHKGIINGFLNMGAPPVNQQTL